MSTVFASQPGQFGQPSGVKYLTEPPPGPVVVPSSVKAPAEEVRNVRARLWAEVNPEGKATTYRFDYLPKAAYEEQGGFEGLATKSFEGELEGEADFKLHGIKQTIGCLDPETEAAQCLSPETTYRWQAVAMNEDGEGNAPVDGGEFTTRPPIEILATYATEAGTDSAHLWAQVNPLGIAATGRLEYVSEATCDEDEAALGEGHCFDHATQVPAEGDAQLDFGGGEEPVIRGAEISGLSPATAYRYRVVVDNPLVEPIAGKAQSVRTFPTAQTRPCPENDAYRSGAGAYLPDCRAYEMVSPLDKENGDVIVRGEFSSNLPAVLERSSLTGDRLAYGSYRAFGDVETSPWTSQYIAQRAAGAHPAEGWRSHGINPPRSEVKLAEIDTELKALSPDLCEAWMITVTDPPPGEGGIPHYANLTRRHDRLCGPERYEELTTIAPPNEPTNEYELELQGSSADGRSAIFAANDSLPGTGAPDLGGGGEGWQLYEWHEGQPLRLACYLPGGAPSSEPCIGGSQDGSTLGKNRGSNLSGALSADGRTAFFTTYSGEPNTPTFSPRHLYARIDGATTLDVSGEGEAIAGTSEASIFWGAAKEGSSAVFSSGERLFRYDLKSKATTELAGEAIGVMGMSEDASRVYLASREAVGGPNAEGRSPVEGQPNLYLWEGGSLTFVITLSGEDIPPSRFAALSRRPSERASRVSPDGLHAAFVSSASPFGYDNTDASSPLPCGRSEGGSEGICDAEAYLYDAGAQKLLCASCNPSGARPAGRFLKFGNTLDGRWVAAMIPPWLDNLYGSRALSEDGNRLFFESTDALSPRDTDNRQDVYEWERAGTGGCSAADPTYTEESGGCIDLISSGQSSRDVEFMDASPDGNDVFFATLAGLVGSDYGLVDAYDARVGGGLPEPPPPASPCEGEACQSPPPPPSQPTPSTESHAGAGNLPAPPGCGAQARRAKRLQRRASRELRRARRAHNPRAAQHLRHRADRQAERSRRLAKSARRCRRRAAR